MVEEEEDRKRRCLERVLAINPGNGRAALELLRLQPARPSVPREGKSHKLVESLQCPGSIAEKQACGRLTVAHVCHPLLPGPVSAPRLCHNSECAGE